MGRLVWRSALLILFVCSPVVQAGSIVNSWHDLNYIDEKHNAFSYSDQMYNDYNEVCVYCHTPHNANSNVAVLWNRNLSDPGTFTMYSSETMDSVSAFPSAVSLLCLSCHDGTVSVDAILNSPNTDWVEEYVHSKLAPYETYEQYRDCYSCHIAGGFGPKFWGFLGSDLSNDHPVSIIYPTEALDLVPTPTDGVFPNGIKLVDGRVECVSCHNVHDPDIRPFLRVADTNSQLCFTCHIK